MLDSARLTRIVNDSPVLLTTAALVAIVQYTGKPNNLSGRLSKLAAYGKIGRHGYRKSYDNGQHRREILWGALA